MNPIYRYFRDIYLGVVTTLLGMQVTFRHIFMPTITVQYPKEKLTYPPRARTLLAVDINSCNGCLQCVRACPVEIIHVETAKALEEDNLLSMPDGKARKLHVLLFDVEMAKCVHCGLCTEACPTESIHWENMHEEISLTQEGMMRRWATYSAEERQRLQQRAAEMKAAKEKAAAEAAAAKAAKEAAEASEKPIESSKQTAPEAATDSPEQSSDEEPQKPETGKPPETPGNEDEKEGE